jgi:5-methylcytosine-specific restriction enzyme subunit McrC
MIDLVDNFYSNSHSFEKCKKNEKNQIANSLQINLSDYLRFKNNKILPIFSDLVNQKKKLDEEIIISIKNMQIPENSYEVRTGNYVGKFFWDGLEVNIGSRFSDIFLKRMLNFFNDIFLDDVDVAGEKTSKENLDFSKFILYYLFIQSLEKAFLLGLPKTYVNVDSHELKFKGRLNFNQLIKKDIPFVGRIASISREQKEDQEIIDVLYKCLAIISAKKFSLKHVSNIMHHLKLVKSGQTVNHIIVKRALNSKALLNPIFSEYKKVLNYAEIIINNYSINNSPQGDKKYYGFIINVAELFEVYVSKLLQRNFADWSITSPEKELYKGYFYSRKIIPDIVMEKADAVLIFDTKYKRMRYQPKNAFGLGDVDRNDFFQINTYMSYYQQLNKNLLAGGLLYPLSEPFKETESHSEYWLSHQNTKTRFVIDGIEVNDSDIKIDTLIENEKAFISRVKELAAEI